MKPPGRRTTSPEGPPTTRNFPDRSIHKAGTFGAYILYVMESDVVQEKRRARRSRVLKAGTMEFSGTSLPCTVRSLSASGAAIEVNSPMWFPDHFTLGIASEGSRRACHIVWRKERRIGLAFD